MSERYVLARPPERFALAVLMGIGATAFNVLNHPNFEQPVADVANAAQFGTIIRTVNPPTTPYGAFLGSAASFRIIQLNARLTF